jgi:hypothetical protein
MATVRLQFRGVTAPHLVAAAISVVPIASVAVQTARGAHATPVLWALSAAVALLPWLSRAAARATYRCKCDDIAVHVRGEALPYKTITGVTVEKSARRTVLRLARGETVELVLVLRDAFAGTLEPWPELRARLEKHGHPVER